VSDETHDVDGARHTTVRGHNITIPVTFKSVKVGRRVRSPRSLSAQPKFPVMPALLTRWAVLPSPPAS
jgi:hypothetical protein